MSGSVFLTAVVSACLCLSRACHFPREMQTPNITQPWHSHIKHDGSRTQTVIIFEGVATLRGEGGTEEWNCTVALKDRFVVQRDRGGRGSVFACVRFYRRSRSVVQWAWSQHGSKLDPEFLCSDSNLMMDPWPLVAFHLLEFDFAPCAVTGGFNMKTGDSFGESNPCNLMDRPMRLESDCLTGEGVTFDFRSRNCLPDVSMDIKQETICVASWSTRASHFSILRRHNQGDVWCLRVPVREREKLDAVLFSDLACPDVEADMETPSKHLKLTLQRVQYTELCGDEYPECADMTCNSYVRRECMKTCRACDSRRPPAICSYPRDFRGSYEQVDRAGRTDIEISESMIEVESVGKFQCVMFPGSPSTSQGLYSTVSISENGCRPRYTCIKIKRLAPSVLAYSISQSLVWPIVDEMLGASICASSQFTADVEPISDIYRSHPDTQKAVVAQYPRPIRVDCNLTSAYTIQATFRSGETCHGSMYEDCRERSRLRMDYTRCDAASQTNEYKCVAVFEGHYWQKIVLIQNVNNENDARCIVFNNLVKLEAMVLMAGECDKLSWNYVKNNVRKPLVTMQIRSDMYPCKNLPTVVERTTSSAIKAKLQNETPEDEAKSMLVTIDPAFRQMTPRPSPPPSRPRGDHDYRHAETVHANRGAHTSGSVLILAVLSGYQLLIS